MQVICKPTNIVTNAHTQYIVADALFIHISSITIASLLT